MKIYYAGRVEKGNRESNDDRALMGREILNQSSACGETEFPFLMAACDGCGGYDKGDYAAQTTLEYLSRFDIGDLLDEEKLHEALEKCNEEILSLKERQPDCAKMCTTIAGCLFDEDRTIIFHSGDTRVYRFDGKYMNQLTKDHSVAQKLVEEGVLSEEEMGNHPSQGVITRCIGEKCLPSEISVSAVPIQPGEIYMICSDGFWEVFTREEVKQLLSSDLGLSEKVDYLIQEALSHGSEDNISVCLCMGEGKPRQNVSRQYILD